MERGAPVPGDVLPHRWDHRRDPAGDGLGPRVGLREGLEEQYRWAAAVLA